MGMQYLGGGLTNGAGVDAFAAGGGPGMQRGGRFVYTASGTKTVATEWAPPSGMVLDGFEVVAVGAGCGGVSGGTAGGGEGGLRVAAYCTLASMGSPSTVAITVGAGVSGAAGGDSSFGGFVFARGGQLRLGGNFANQTLTPLEVLLKTNTVPGEGRGGDSSAALTAPGGQSPTGSRGGGGGANVSFTGYPGGAVYPRPGAVPRANSSNVWDYLGGNATGSGVAGEDGIGDWPGNGGNGGGTGGVGGFPGGGGGAGSAAPRGGHGVVIVYPWFKKA